MSAYAYDENMKIVPVSKYDFVPHVEISENERRRIDSGVKKDPDFHCSIYTKKTANSTEKDLLLPFEKKCSCCGFEFDSEEDSTKNFYKTKLSKYLDADKQDRLKHFIVLHRTGKFDILFDIKKGNNKANDPDGIINVNFDPVNIKGITVSCTPSSGGKDYLYNKKLKMSLEVSNEESFVCSLNFYSHDNNNGFTDWAGRVTDKIHCGEIGLLLYKCICSDWLTIPSVIPQKISKIASHVDENFVGWPGSTGNCFKLSVQQIEKNNCVLVDTGYDEKSPNIFQIWKDTNNDKVNDLTGDSQKKRFVECIAYLKEALNDGIPVIAGVDNMSNHPGNGDLTTDHFVTIVGMGKDSKGCYFLFYDNAISSASQGTSKNNKFYVDCRNYTMAVDYTANNYTVSVYNAGKYTKHYVTQVRKSKKK